METEGHPDAKHEYMVDSATVAAVVSGLLQVVISLIGAQKAKAALDSEVVKAARVAADIAVAATDVYALQVLRTRGVLGSSSEPSDAPPSAPASP